MITSSVFMYIRQIASSYSFTDRTARLFSPLLGAFLGILWYALPIHVVSNGRIVRVRCAHHQHNLSPAAAIRMVRKLPSAEPSAKSRLYNQ